MNSDYKNRLLEFESKKRELEERALTPEEYQKEIRRLAAAYGV